MPVINLSNNISGCIAAYRNAQQENKEMTDTDIYNKCNII